MVLKTSRVSKVFEVFKVLNCCLSHDWTWIWLSNGVCLFFIGLSTAMDGLEALKISEDKKKLLGLSLKEGWMA